MEAFRWAFIGTGTLARGVIRELLPSGRHRIASVYTRRWEKCQEFAEETGAFAARSAEEAINRADVDGVYIVTPHNSHYEYAKLALSLGKPVLCEKPVTTDSRQAEELIALSKEKGVYFAEGMWTWFSPIANQVKAWLDAGEYGELEKVSVTYRVNVIHYAPRLADPQLAGGALLDSGIYPITYLYRLFGKPVSVSCRGKLKDGIDLGERVTLGFADGRSITADISMVDRRNWEWLRIIGSRARTDLRAFHYANEVTLRLKNGKAIHFSGDGSMLNEFDRVAEEIRAGRTDSLLVPQQCTLDVMRILDECRRQMGLIYPFEK